MSLTTESQWEKCLFFDVFSINVFWRLSHHPCHVVCLRTWFWFRKITSNRSKAPAIRDSLLSHLFINLHPPKTPFVSDVGGPEQQTTLDRISGIKKTCNGKNHPPFMSLFWTRGKAGWVLFVMHLNSDSLFLSTILPEKYTASLFYFHLNTVTKYNMY